jgi:hypothetical protein
MGHRNANALAPSLLNFKSFNNCYSFLLNQNAKPRDESSSRVGFAQAEIYRGSKQWDEFSKETGFKFMTVAEAGSERHRLDADPTQPQCQRFDFERMHFKGIVTVLFRNFILSSVSKANKLALRRQVHAIVQPAGTKPILPLIKLDKKGNASVAGGEKLHQKKHWREHRLFSDLYPLFPEGHKMRKV